jgi:hypothetical protein
MYDGKDDGTDKGKAFAYGEEGESIGHRICSSTIQVKGTDSVHHPMEYIIDMFDPLPFPGRRLALSKVSLHSWEVQLFMVWKYKTFVPKAQFLGSARRTNQQE